MGESITTRFSCRLSCLFFLLTRSLARPIPTSAGGILKDSSNLVLLEGICTAYLKEVMADVGREELVCQSSKGMVYNVPNVDKKWITEKKSAGELISGETVLVIPWDTMIDMETYTLQLSSPPGLSNDLDDDTRNRRRQLRKLAATGTKTVLGVRIVATDATTSLSEDELADDIFGITGDTMNMKSQYLDCSFDQFELNQADDRTGQTTSIQNGVTTIEIDLATSDGTDAILNAVTEQLLTEFSTDSENLADYIMYCMPPGTMGDTEVAFAFLNGYQSWYNDEACSYVSAQMHEVGHNIGMGHSSEDSSEYGDQSGLMGFSYEYDDIPFMCFNSAKSWQLGWYEDKAVTVTPAGGGTTSFSTTLASIVDYESTDGKVLIRINQDSVDTDYYMNYNAAKGMNSQTQEGINQVLITKKDTTDDSNVSFRVAELDAGGTFTLDDFNGNTGETLTITVNSISNDEADISIVLTGFSTTDTPAPTVTPSKVPTAAPSSTPSMAPSTIPSMVSPPTVSSAPSTSANPSTAPTKSPSAMSSNESSATPSKSPSKVPTAAPSSTPSMAPSTTASRVPPPTVSSAPSTSANPSAAPTKSPSAMPSNEPSATPSTSKPPRRVPTSAPSASPSIQTSSQRTATVELEIGITGLVKLNVICTAIQEYINQFSKETYGSDTQTTITCSRSLVGRRLFWITKNEEPILVLVTTTFPRGRSAPRQFRYGKYLNQVIVGEETSTQLPAYIVEAATASGESFDGVSTALDTSIDPPVLMILFGEDNPISQPTSQPASNPTSGEDGEESSLGTPSVRVRLSFALAASISLMAIL